MCINSIAAGHRHSVALSTQTFSHNNLALLDGHEDLIEPDEEGDVLECWSP